MEYAYVLDGQTFQHRHAIRESKWFFYDGPTKSWVAKINPSSIKERESILKFVKGLPGVSVLEEPAEKFKVLR